MELKAGLTKSELEDKYFYEFLVWCSTPPNDNRASELLWWLDHNQPTQDNFWEWLVKCKKGELNAA